MLRFLTLSALILLLVGCGDWGTDGSSQGFAGQMRFHYYYGQDCSWIGEDYLCGAVYALSRPLTVSVTVEWNDYVTVYYDGVGPFDFGDRDYVYDFDPVYREFYYQFNLDGNYSLTVFELGAEAIYVDTYTGVEYHYFHDVW